MYKDKCKTKCKQNKIRNIEGRCVSIPKINNKNKNITIKLVKEKQTAVSKIKNLLIPYSFTIPDPENKNKTNKNEKEKQEISNFYEYLNRLQTIGKKYQNKGIYYKNETNYFYPIMILYLIKKYNSQCVILDEEYKITRFKNISTIQNDLIHKKTINKMAYKFMRQILQCIKRNKKNENYIAIIPISFGTNIGQSSFHANMLIYRHKTATLEHFEPHGSMVGAAELVKEADKLYQVLQKMVSIMNDLNKKKQDESKNMNMDLSYYEKEITYVPPSKLCPYIRGFQTLENYAMIGMKENIKEKEGKGFCIFWGIFFAELVLLNNALSSETILTTILEWANEKNNYMYMRNIIRGYIYYIMDQYDEILIKKMKKNFFTAMQQPATKEEFVNILTYINNEFYKINRENFDKLVKAPDTISISV